MVQSSDFGKWDCPRCLRENPQNVAMCRYCGSDREGNKGPTASVRSESPASVGSESPGFRTLKGYGRFMAGCGWLLIILGVVVLAVDFAEMRVGALTGMAIALIPVGITFVVSGQVISCFVSIERNTRETNELLKQLNK